MKAVIEEANTNKKNNIYTEVVGHLNQRIKMVGELQYFKAVNNDQLVESETLITDIQRFVDEANKNVKKKITDEIMEKKEIKTLIKSENLSKKNFREAVEEITRVMFESGKIKDIIEKNLSRVIPEKKEEELKNGVKLVANGYLEMLEKKEKNMSTKYWRKKTSLLLIF